MTICILWVELLNSLHRVSGFPLAWFWLVSVQNWAPGPQRQSCKAQAVGSMQMCNLSELGRSRGLCFLVQVKPSPFTQPWCFQLKFCYFECGEMFCFVLFFQKNFKQWPNENERSLFKIMTLQRPDWAVSQQTSMCQPMLVTIAPSRVIPCSLTPLGLQDGPFLEFQHDISKHVYLPTSRIVFISIKWNCITYYICIWPNRQTWTPSVIHL